MCRFAPLRQFWKQLLLCALAIVGSAARSAAVEVATGFQERVYHDDSGDHRYTVFVPAAYTVEKKWPVILYLHGAGSRGSDNKLPLENGLPPQVRTRAATFPCLVVIPQCEDMNSRLLYGWHADAPDGQRALRILDDVERDYNVDRRREILTGWSMGGFGAWSLGAVDSGRWSAMLVIAGGGDLEMARRLKGVPIWAIHCTSDPGVPIAIVRPLVAEIQKSGGRIHLTELGEAKHNIGHIAYGDDAVYEWMLNPQSDPKEEGITRGMRREPRPDEIGDGERPFVPAAIVPEAVYVHLDSAALLTAAYAAPGMVPANALSGSVPDVYDTKRAFLSRFDIAVSGINYRGTLERMRVVTRKDGWATIALGLRDMTMEIGSTQVNGRFLSATAGPMQVVVGHTRPAVLILDVRPYVEGERCRLELASVKFEIADDNFYVTTPEVMTRTLPFFRSRASAAITSNLVNAAYARKSEIESHVRDAAPTLVKRIEEGLDRKFAQVHLMSHWPNPKSQPRFKLWPNRLQVDERGLSLLLGMTIAARDPNAAGQTVRRIERPALHFADIPQHGGLEIGLCASACEGLTAVATDAALGSLDVRDLVVPEFGALAERERLIEAIPDIKRFGDQLQIRSTIRAVAPIDFTSVPSESSSQMGTGGKRSAGYSDEILLRFQGVRLDVTIKTPDQLNWTPCAEFDIRFSQRMKISIHSPDFEQRIMSTVAPEAANIEVTGRFAAGYPSSETNIRCERILALYEAGWRQAAKLDALQRLCVADLAIGTARLRLAEVGWSDPLLIKRFVPATTRITNGGHTPVAYEIRGPFSDWGGPYTLDPGRSHDFPFPYPVMVRTNIASHSEPFRVPMGNHLILGREGKAVNSDTIATKPSDNMARQ